MFGVQVKVYNPHTKSYDWLWMCPSGTSEPYRWETGDEAHRMKKMCYPQTTIDWVRVAKFED